MFSRRRLDFDELTDIRQRLNFEEVATTSNLRHSQENMEAQQQGTMGTDGLQENMNGGNQTNLGTGRDQDPTVDVPVDGPGQPIYLGNQGQVRPVQPPPQDNNQQYQPYPYYPPF